MPFLLPVPNLKAFLLGSWKIDRTVIDRAQAITGRFQGEARLTRRAGGLLYQEHGTLAFGEHCGPAEQTYFYDFPEDDGRASVRFRDGRAFYSFDLADGEARVCHACSPDYYEGVIIALSSTAWRSEWKVSGPRKNYDLVTTYNR